MLPEKITCGKDIVRIATKNWKKKERQTAQREGGGMIQHHISAQHGQE